MSRGLPRDVFDVAMLPERSPGLVGNQGFRSLVIAWCGLLHHPLYAYGRDRLDRLTEGQVEHQLHTTLSGSERPSVVDLVERAWRVVDPLLALTDREREYAECIQRGELRLDLLFVKDDPSRDRLEHHPALQWKIQNARAHHYRQGRDEEV